MSKTLEKRIVALEAEHKPDIVRRGMEIEAMLKARELGFDALIAPERALLTDDRLQELQQTYVDYVSNRCKGVRIDHE